MTFAIVFMTYSYLGTLFTTVELDGIMIVISIAMDIKTKNVAVWVPTDIV